MNIMFLTHRVPYPPNKGEKIRIFHQIKYLAGNGHTIYLCAPISNIEGYYYLNRLEKYCKKIISARQIGGARWISGYLKGQPLSVINFYTKNLQNKIDKFLFNHKVDAIVCSSSSMAEYVFNSRCLESRGLSSPKLIMDFIDLDSDKWRQYERMRSFPLKQVYHREAMLLSQYEKKIHRRFDAVLFISQAEVDLFLKYEHEKDSSKIHVICNGLDSEFFRPKPLKTPDPVNGPVLLFTGVMDYFPNEDAVTWFADTVWGSVRKQWPRAKFIIAGMNPSHKVKKLSKLDGIEVTGFVEDIRKYYYKADFFVAPFRIARGVQNKILQAFATALPVVTTDIGREGIECYDGKELLTANNPVEFIKHFRQLMEDGNLRGNLVRNALELVHSRYEWSECIKSLDHVLTH